jgi:NhaP-type Na+/H+ or K+/H+ antiporter
MGSQQGRAMGGACLGTFLGLILGAIGGWFIAGPPLSEGPQNSISELGVALAVIITRMFSMAIGGALGAIFGGVIGAGVATSEQGRTESRPAPETPSGKSIEPDQMID